MVISYICLNLHTDSHGDKLTLAAAKRETTRRIKKKTQNWKNVEEKSSIEERSTKQKKNTK